MLAQLAPQPADEHINGSVQRVACTALREIKQLVARQHTAGPIEEDTQQVELGCGQFDLRSCRSGKQAALRVEAEPGFGLPPEKWSSLK